MLTLLPLGCAGRPGEAAERALAETFLEGIRVGRVEEAWTGASPEFKSFMGKDQFKSFVWSNPVLKEKAVFEKAEPLPEGKWVLCSFAGKSKKVLLTLGPEEGGWKVVGMKVE